MSTTMNQPLWPVIPAALSAIIDDVTASQTDVWKSGGGGREVHEICELHGSKTSTATQSETYA